MLNITLVSFIFENVREDGQEIKQVEGKYVFFLVFKIQEKVGKKWKKQVEEKSYPFKKQNICPYGKNVS